MPQRVLVTGATGFLASYAIPALKEQGYYVVGLSQSAHHQLDIGQCDEYFCVDINDAEKLADVVVSISPDIVVHLAGLSFVAHPEPLDFYRVNVLGTENLLNALSLLPAKQVKQVFLASSATVYGANAIGKINESTVALPQNHYAQSKLAMELVARNYLSHFSISILRLFNFTGVGQAEHFLIPKLVKHFLSKSNVIELGNINVSRDFCDVRDIVGWLVELVKQASCYTNVTQLNAVSTYNLSSGAPTKLQGLLGELSSLSGVKPEIQQLKALMRANETESLWGDNAKVIDQTGRSLRYSLPQTLAWMLLGTT